MRLVLLVATLLAAGAIHLLPGRAGEAVGGHEGLEPPGASGGEASRPAHVAPTPSERRESMPALAGRAERSEGPAGRSEEEARNLARLAVLGREVLPDDPGTCLRAIQEMARLEGGAARVLLARAAARGNAPDVVREALKRALAGTRARAAARTSSPMAPGRE